MGYTQHRLRVRRAGDAAAGREIALVAEAGGGDPPAAAPEPPSAPLAVDGVVVPALLLLTARHLAAQDPPRVLAWRLLHDDDLAARAAFLGPLLPRPSGDLDRDPIALALAALAAALAFVYLVAVLAGARVRTRLGLLGLAAGLLVALPTLSLVAMGAVTGRPYGQDGGVVQLPLAIDLILSGRSPYGADYSSSMLGRQARVSDFWAEHGGNPILRHHAYLPGTHLLMIPFVPVSRAVLGTFDPRLVTLGAFAVAGLLAFSLSPRADRGLAAAAAVWVSPLVYWQQAFGANDVLPAALLLGSAHLARAGRSGWAAAALGLACATKQLAWPFAPFLLSHLSGARALPDLLRRPFLGRLVRAGAVAGGVFLAVVAPVAALDPRAFWADIVVYNAGLPGGDNYPLGGTPGLGLANLLVYFGTVTSLRDHVPLGSFYLLLVPLGLCLLWAQLRHGTVADALAAGSVALLLALYVSRVFHPNYLILAAVLLPAAVAAGARIAIDAVAGGLLLLATAVEIAEGEVFAALWADAAAARWPSPRDGLLAALAPRAGPALTHDPLGLALTAAASGLAVALLAAGALGARPRWRAGILGAALAVVIAVPAGIATKVGRLSGTPRVQDGWAATVWPRPPRTPPPRLREAWSRSFRKDAPGSVEARNVAPGSPALAVALHSLGVRDPRGLVVIALAATVALLVAMVPTAPVLVAMGALLMPASAIGAVFGSGDPVLLALTLAAIALALRGRRSAGAVTLGLGAGLFPRALPAVALAASARGPSADAPGARRPHLRSVVVGLALACGAGLAAGGAPDAPVLGAGLGLSNLRPRPGLRRRPGPG
ncbi:MAG TPA: glycosyltransferase 87 family protein, partial [Vicinamibacteria bacterium]|nr:glycosyltransferase 87 family protein [Vicinamibacteria bacterium]